MAKPTTTEYESHKIMCSNVDDSQAENLVIVTSTTVYRDAVSGIVCVDLVAASVANPQASLLHNIILTISRKNPETSSLTRGQNNILHQDHHHCK